MKPFEFYSLMIALVFLALPIIANEQKYINVKMQIFRVSGTLSGETRLEENVWPDDSKPDHETIKNITVFTKGSFQIGKHTLECTQNEWSLNNDKIKLDETPTELEQLKIISAPSISVISGENMNVDITASQVVEYFERRDDGAYERREVSPRMGFEFDTTVEIESQEIVRLRDLTLTLRSIEKREDLEGVKLNVGKPVVAERESVVQMLVESGKNYGLLFQSEDGRGVLIIRLYVEVSKEEEK